MGILLVKLIGDDLDRISYYSEIKERKEEKDPIVRGILTREFKDQWDSKELKDHFQDFYELEEHWLSRLTLSLFEVNPIKSTLIIISLTLMNIVDTLILDVDPYIKVVILISNIDQFLLAIYIIHAFLIAKHKELLIIKSNRQSIRFVYTVGRMVLEEDRSKANNEALSRNMTLNSHWLNWSSWIIILGSIWLMVCSTWTWTENYENYNGIFTLVCAWSVLIREPFHAFCYVIVFTMLRERVVRCNALTMHLSLNSKHLCDHSTQNESDDSKILIEDLGSRYSYAQRIPSSEGLRFVFWWQFITSMGILISTAIGIKDDWEVIKSLTKMFKIYLVSRVFQILLNNCLSYFAIYKLGRAQDKFINQAILTKNQDLVDRARDTAGFHNPISPLQGNLMVSLIQLANIISFIIILTLRAMKLV